MKRREFVAGLAGAVVWALVARAQQTDRMRRIGVIMSLAADDAEGRARVAAFRRGLQELGWADGENIRIDIRWGAGDSGDARKYSAELVALAPDAILVSGGSSVGTLLQMTRTIPVVFTQTPDPVGAGFVATLARPGGNATGFVTFEYGMASQWLELLKKLSPLITRAAVFRDPTIAQG